MEQVTYTSEQLEKMLAETKAKEKAEKQAEKKRREKERQDYEASRDSKVLEMMEMARNLNIMMAEFKLKCHDVFDEHKEILNQYGTIKSNSKGGFSLQHSNGEIKIARVLATQPQWSEVSMKGVEILKNFLVNTVKKRDLKIFELLFAFLQKNKHGDLEYSRVMELLKHQDTFEEPEWLEGLKLLKEGYSIAQRGYHYTFHEKDEHGTMNPVSLNFSSI